MKRALIVIFTLAIAVTLRLGFSAALPQETSNAAHQEVGKVHRPLDAFVHDFGKVAHGTYCSHCFRIDNASDLPMEILNVRSSGCGTASTSVDRMKLPPRTSAKLTVGLDTRRFFGAKTASIFVTTQVGEGGFKEQRFTITCDSEKRRNINEFLEDLLRSCLGAAQ